MRFFDDGGFGNDGRCALLNDDGRCGVGRVGVGGRGVGRVRRRRAVEEGSSVLGGVVGRVAGVLGVRRLRVLGRGTAVEMRPDVAGDGFDNGLRTAVRVRVGRRRGGRAAAGRGAAGRGRGR